MATCLGCTNRNWVVTEDPCELSYPQRSKMAQPCHLLFAYVAADAPVAEATYQQSSLDWTIVRPPG
jgi:hypothetical protein